MKRLGLTEIKSYVLSHTGNKGQKKKKKKRTHPRKQIWIERNNIGEWFP